MGNSMKKEVQVILEGRQGSGKSSALFHLKNGETLLTPTPGSEGFYVESATHAGTKLNVWEVQPSSTIVREKSLTMARALVFVVDSTEDSIGIEQAKRSLYNILNALASQKPRACFTLLVLANKQDLPGAVSPAAVERSLDLSSRPDGKTWKWAVQSCSAKAGVGLKEGMDWLATAVRSKNGTSIRPAKRFSGSSRSSSGSSGIGNGNGNGSSNASGNGSSSNGNGNGSASASVIEVERGGGNGVAAPPFSVKRAPPPPSASFGW
ncbi:unnamed protein product [Pylaiella littoralis]